MPKILKDVENTIRNSSMELFIEFSYNHVDMKMISKKSGVAVGTLYNYYKNKEELYLSILKESWKETFSKLDSISDLNISPEEKLKEFIKILYEDTESRNGLGKVLTNNSSINLKDDKEINDLKNQLILKTENIFKSLNKVDSINNCPKLNTRLAESSLMSLLMMLEFHPKDKEDNIDFLIKFISLSIK